jgi:signal transduction histidine kinase
VRADADRLQRVVENLVSNGIKYSPGGGTVEVCVGAEGAQAVLTVRDHGIGVSPDAMPRIFERAYRAPDAAVHAPGLGLGLSIAAQVVTHHAGTIAAAPAAGGGTVLTVRLPLTRGESRPMDGTGVTSYGRARPPDHAMSEHDLRSRRDEAS